MIRNSTISVPRLLATTTTSGRCMTAPIIKCKGTETRCVRRWTAKLPSKLPFLQTTQPTRRTLLELRIRTTQIRIYHHRTFQANSQLSHLSRSKTRKNTALLIKRPKLWTWTSKNLVLWTTKLKNTVNKERSTQTRQRVSQIWSFAWTWTLSTEWQTTSLEAFGLFWQASSPSKAIYSWLRINKQNFSKENWFWNR